MTMDVVILTRNFFGGGAKREREEGWEVVGVELLVMTMLVLGSWGWMRRRVAVAVVHNGGGSYAIAILDHTQQNGKD